MGQLKVATKKFVRGLTGFVRYRIEANVRASIDRAKGPPLELVSRSTVLRKKIERQIHHHSEFSVGIFSQPNSWAITGVTSKADAAISDRHLRMTSLRKVCSSRFSDGGSVVYRKASPCGLSCEKRFARASLRRSMFLFQARKRPQATPASPVK